MSQSLSELPVVALVKVTVTYWEGTARPSHSTCPEYIYLFPDSPKHPRQKGA
jgi:hypothetical protein